MTHICDCGATYNDTAAVLMCATTNHGQTHGELERYEAWVESVWDRGGNVDLRGLAIMAAGIGGEAGEVQELLNLQLHGVLQELAVIASESTALGKEVSDVSERVKKHIRNNRQLTREEMTSELGDVLYHVVRIARWQGISMRQIIAANREKIDERLKQRGWLPSGNGR